MGPISSMFMMVISCHVWPHSEGITWRPPGISWGVRAPLHSNLFLPECTSPNHISTGSAIPYSCLGVQ